ncbi:diaminobutyrate--2-oxoglutarate transaminase family protein [Francisella noatunensis]|uniref:Diaminobutyrate--2-oxoglutarate transaminase family protein n=1 Tax=Francisella noatunensis TaxID=657445 RepID=A0A9Q2KRE7_9GAMM|nr:diaminobutyrate--2-oxoglutarate transaminase family protein [Francisella noatunensis]MBK2028923.1 diaminobutyrate--2-oxoglutarate transaminase family protein [Francisella noatunensis]MBK2033328.1 diaminobutyrate--2-oxoglutarate transaminase family protein [Francisella noatunensis]MBK2048040.1 diaminobutyrate--2-oxoglutarate transaminase family protein [Francisella noatunensis]MBK2050330.1 diaminobutyrate--2-oxoglutarate transaminase family protein [Francisella noatunensis]MBK2051636.1 diami
MNLQSQQTMLENQATWESNARSYPRKNPLVIKKAQGVYLTDIENKKYIDCLAGAGTIALGHNDPEITNAISQTLNNGVPIHTLYLLTEEKHSFMEELLNTLPQSYHGKTKIHFCSPSGSDAVEAAIKLCKTATGRENIIAFHGAYHGMTHGTLSLMGNLEPKQDIAGLTPYVHFLPYPYSYRCPFGLKDEQSIDINIQMISRLLKDPESGIKKPAAIILEPVQGEGGVIPAPVKWLKAIRELTKELDIPLIVDEVQCGIGRTGYLYAFEKAGIDPDVIVLSKALGGGLPISVILYKSYLDTWKPGAHTGTFRGNVLAMVAGSVVLKRVNNTDFLKQVSKKGNYLLYKLHSLKNKYNIIGDVRGSGLMIGMEIVDIPSKPDSIGSLPADGKKALAIKKTCFDMGLIVELGGRFGGTIRLLPPLTITIEQINEVVQILEDSIKENI